VSARAERLRETFDALEAIGRRLSLSIDEDAGLFPVASGDAASHDIHALRALDAFLHRFTQLLDHLLRKLFPRLQAAISDDDELLPVRALLENLHRAGIVEDPTGWLELIEVRNRLTHEYAMSPDERATALNDAWSRAPALLAQIEDARRYARRHDLLRTDRSG
jgi:hypothetical protein